METWYNGGRKRSDFFKFILKSFLASISLKLKKKCCVNVFVNINISEPLSSEVGDDVIKKVLMSSDPRPASAAARGSAYEVRTARAAADQLLTQLI